MFFPLLLFWLDLYLYSIVQLKDYRITKYLIWYCYLNFSWSWVVLTFREKWNRCYLQTKVKMRNLQGTQLLPCPCPGVCLFPPCPVQGRSIFKIFALCPALYRAGQGAGQGGPALWTPLFYIMISSRIILYIKEKLYYW